MPSKILRDMAGRMCRDMQEPSFYAVEAGKSLVQKYVINHYGAKVKAHIKEHFHIKEKDKNGRVISENIAGKIYVCDDGNEYLEVDNKTYRLNKSDQTWVPA